MSDPKCLRCGADSSWIEGGTRSVARDVRRRAAVRRRLLKAWKMLWQAAGLDVSHGWIADRMLYTLADAHELLGGKRLPNHPALRRTRRP